MGKKIFATLIVAVVATFAGYNIYQSQRAKNTMSELAMANVEALADIYCSLQKLRLQRLSRSRRFSYP